MIGDQQGLPAAAGADPAAAPSPSRTNDTLDPIGRVFRVVAFAEALSWAGLLVAMFFKWVVQEDPNAGIEGGVPIVGPIHGALFVAYVVVALLAARRFRWRFGTTLLALAASIPPFLTAVFEAVAERKGRLRRP